MIEDFKNTDAHGLEIHPSKTKIRTNQRTNKLREIEIGEMRVEILLPGGKVKHLGQLITFAVQETTEVQYRIWCAWSRHRQGLTSQSFLTTTPTAPLRRCCHTELGNGLQQKISKKMLRIAQRRMLRLIIQTNNTKTRRKLEQKTFVTTKSARRLKKTALILNAIKTATFHSMMVKTAQQAMKTFWKTGLKRYKQG